MSNSREKSQHTISMLRCCCHAIQTVTLHECACLHAIILLPSFCWLTCLKHACDNKDVHLVGCTCNARHGGGVHGKHTTLICMNTHIHTSTNRHTYTTPLQVTILHAGQTLCDNSRPIPMPQKVSDKLRKKLEDNGVNVMCGERVTSMSPKDFEKEKVRDICQLLREICRLLHYRRPVHSQTQTQTRIYL